MRFRFGLPVLQTAAMLVILWAPWAPGAHKIEVVLQDGREFRGTTIVPNTWMFDATGWAQALNLPAILAEIPIDLAVDNVRGRATLPDHRVRFFLFWSLGLLIWYFLGRFIEDTSLYYSTKTWPPPHKLDLVFAIEAALVATLGALVSIFGGRPEFPVVLWSSAIWFVVAFAILTGRVAQFLSFRKHPIRL